MEGAINTTAAPSRAGSGLPALPHRPQWLGVLALGLLTLASSWFAFRMTRFGGVAALWIANGMLTGALLLTATKSWRWWMLAAALGQMLARVLVGDTWLQVIGLALINIGECGLVAIWVRRRIGHLGAARSLGVLARDALIGALAACLVSATLALPILLTREGTTPLVSWASWFTAHLLGMVIVGTLTICVFQPNVRLFGSPGRRVDFLICILLLLAVLALAFGQERYSLLFLAFLPLLLLAFRHGLSGMVMGTILLAGVSGIAAAKNAGAFALLHESRPVARLFYWQLYVAAGCLLAYGTALTMTVRRQLERRVRASQAQMKALTDHLPAMVARLDHEARYLYANPRSHAMVPGVELVGKKLSELRSPSQYEELRPHVDAVLRGEPQEFETWMRGKDGERVELRAQFVPDIGPEGRVQGFYSMAFDITAAKNFERELAQLARFDPLTGLANRRHFDEALQAAVARAHRNGTPLMVIALDLDRFKQINDTLGHAVGDAVLREFSMRVRGSVYDVDLVARLGGDEFLVLVEYTPTAAAGERIALHLIDAMRTPFEIDGHSIQVATSIGIGVQQPVTSGEELVALADKALYEAKARGRNTWALCEA